MGSAEPCNAAGNGHAPQPGSVGASQLTVIGTVPLKSAWQPHPDSGTLHVHDAPNTEHGVVDVQTTTEPETSTYPHSVGPDGATQTPKIGCVVEKEHVDPGDGTAKPISEAGNRSEE